jgi:hypothetical protein
MFQPRCHKTCPGAEMAQSRCRRAGLRANARHSRIVRHSKTAGPLNLFVQDRPSEKSWQRHVHVLSCGEAKGGRVCPSSAISRLEPMTSSVPAVSMTRFLALSVLSVCQSLRVSHLPMRRTECPRFTCIRPKMAALPHGGMAPISPLSHPRRRRFTLFTKAQSVWAEAVRESRGQDHIMERVTMRPMCAILMATSCKLSITQQRIEGRLR